MGCNYYYCWYFHSLISSLLPVHRQAVTQSIPDLLLTAPIGTYFNFNKIVFENFYLQIVSHFVEASICEVEKSALLTYILFQLFVKVNKYNANHVQTTAAILNCEQFLKQLEFYWVELNSTPLVGLNPWPLDYMMRDMMIFYVSALS